MSTTASRSDDPDRIACSTFVVEWSSMQHRAIPQVQVMRDAAIPHMT
jgi:hypothetical protein